MRTDAGAIARVVAFTVVSLAFVFILVTVFGQFRFDSRTSSSVNHPDAFEKVRTSNEN